MSLFTYGQAISCLFMCAKKLDCSLSLKEGEFLYRKKKLLIMLGGDSRRGWVFLFSYIVFITFQFCWVVVIFSITHWTGTIDNIITFLKNSGVSYQQGRYLVSRTNLFFQCFFFVWIFSSFNGFNGFWQKEDILFLI